MAKRVKDRLYYEVTKEKPFGLFHMLMVGGAAGSVLAFLTVSLVGAYEGTEMDSLVFAFLLSSFLGFFFGALLTWAVVSFFEKWIPVPAMLGMEETSPVQAAGEPEVVEAPVSEMEKGPIVENEEVKGSTVDFIFPELSPDKQ
jgi:hypothetical protein